MMSEHEDWKRSALRYLETCNIKHLFAREFRTENLSLKLKDTKTMTVPKYLPLVVDLMLVADLSVALAQLIIHNPTLAESVFVQAVQEIIINDSSISPIPETPIFESQVNQRNPWRPFPMHINFHLKGIPSHLFSSSLSALKFASCWNLVAIKGILISLTPISKYMRSGVYSCSDSMCPESIKRRVPVLREKKIMDCHLCSSKLVEHAEERDIGNVVKAIVALSAADIPFGSKEPDLQFHFQRGIMVKFYDSLALRLKIGEHYDVAGYMTSQGMHAYYVQKSVPPRIFDSISWSKLDNILQLKTELDHSPWSFFIAVASQICSDFYPVSSFLHLKRGILLSLASLVCMSRPIHILAVGSENLPAYRFMMHASRIAPCFVVHSHQQPIMGKTRWQEEQMGGNTLWFDAGSLYLAQGGICYMGAWEKQNKETQTSVLSAIERRQIAIVAEKKTVTSDLRFPLRTAVWTHSCSKKKDKLRPLIDVFGIPFTMETDLEEHNDIVYYLLHNSPSQTKLQNWKLETKMFIQNLASKEITMEPNATKLIQDYFVASRRCRGLTDSDHCLPIGSINMIMQMAEAHARISLHPTVTQADALAAIDLSEEALSALYGQSLIPKISPLRLSKVSNWSQYSYEVDRHMKQFGKWLDKYLQDLVGESFHQMPREE